MLAKPAHKLCSSSELQALAIALISITSVLPLLFVGHCRVQAASLLLQGWTTEFHWLPLQRDPVLNVVSRKVSLGRHCSGDGELISP